jgi:pectate lyase
MRLTLAKIVGGMMVVAISFATTFHLLKRYTNICIGGNPITASAPFKSFGEKGFIAGVQVANGDSSGEPSRSTLILCEDEKRLGPAHSLHTDIRDKGLGRYSHWGAEVVFSTSDNSDPNTNHRRYSYVP